MAGPAFDQNLRSITFAQVRAPKCRRVSGVAQPGGMGRTCATMVRGSPTTGQPLLVVKRACVPSKVSRSAATRCSSRGE
jgi:hypothetical protein